MKKLVSGIIAIVTAVATVMPVAASPISWVYACDSKEGE